MTLDLGHQKSTRKYLNRSSKSKVNIPISPEEGTAMFSGVQHLKLLRKYSKTRKIF